MRRITRNTILAIVGVLVVLLAFGALPSYLQTGDPYYVEATTADDDGTAIDAGNLSERRFPYAFGALESAAAGDDSARSEAYYTGPIGFKESFTHTPFDEFSEFEGRDPTAIERSAESPIGDVAYLRYEGERYRLEIIREAEP